MDPDTDLVSALRSLDAPLSRPGLSGADVDYAVHESPVGQLVLAVDAAGAVLACSYDAEEVVTDRLARAVSPRVLRRPGALDPLRRSLDAYFDGTRHDIPAAVDLALATPFARRVLLALRDVPFGTTVSYGDLAAAIGAPGASRAVGGALGSNPVCLVLACHRVVRSDGSPGGYAGGARAKASLLALEAPGGRPPAAAGTGS